MKIINRKEAQALGYNKYFTGVHCRNGHLAERYTASGTCSECINGKRKTGSNLNPETYRKLAQQTALAALADYNANLKRITDIYDKQMLLVKEYENNATEREQRDLMSMIAISNNGKLIEEREKLKPIWVVYTEENREEHEAYYLSLLQKRCPELTINDMRGRNTNKGGIMFKIKCYPEDKQHIADVTAGRVKPQSQH